MSDADQKTEAPTPRRIQRAFEEGQIGFSADLIGGLILLVGVLYFVFMGRPLIQTLQESLRNRLTNFDEVVRDPTKLPEIAIQSLATLTGVLLGLLVPLFFVSLLSGGLQTRFNLTFKPLEMKWSRINPLSGFKRIFSLRAVVRGVVALLKSAVVGLVSYYLVHSELVNISVSGFGTLNAALTTLLNLAASISLTIAALMVVIGVADLAFQKWKQNQDLRMSMQDIRDERKEDEGDPLLRARMRRMQAEIVEKSFRKEVPTANVVVTNPTHFAVALRYDRTKAPAPIVVAKGSDFLAKKIIELAQEHGVPIVERKPVARFLYFNVRVGKTIPVEMYQAVAEVLNYINRLRKRRKSA